MCSDENSAPNAVRYLNAQLAVLHENAKRCLDEHDQARTEDNKRFYALAEFVVQKPGTCDSAFRASFGKPELELICDHDAVLHLTLTSGQLLLDSLRPGGQSGLDTVPDLRLAYRVGFETRKIVGNDLKIGDHGSSIELVILNLKKATFLSAEPEVTAGRDLLLRYMIDYLELLHSAGNNVLFSLPRFGRHGTTMFLDYSLMGSAHYWVGDINGVTVEQVNSYMSSVWLKSAMLAHGGNSQATDWNLRSLAEFSTSSMGLGSAIGNFRIKFGAPRVDIICPREVITHFNIDELEFFATDDFDIPPERKYKEWQIALVVNVLYTSEADGQMVKIAFDLSHARYHDAASEFPGYEDSDDELANEYWRQAIAFFTEEYLQILESARYHIIYSRDTRWEAVSKRTSTVHEDSEGSWWSSELAAVSGASTRETIQRAKMFGFDQVVAISQASINAQFSTLCANLQSIFYRWHHESFFGASFRPMTIHLLSGNRAIVWVHLQGGHMKTLQDWVPSDGSMKYEFGECQLAFEVDLKMCTQDELEGVAPEASRKSSAYQMHGNRPERDLKHIYLDLRNAEYLHDYSTFGDVSGGSDNRLSILKLQAVVYYLTQHYFPAICKEAQHIVSSVPVWKAGKYLPSSALTSLAFHVYSKVEVTRHNWAHVPAGVVVVFGMTGFRPLPSEHLDYSTGWIVQSSKGFSHGTISISKRVFIEERLLSLLSRINALTTLIPSTPDVFQAFHGLKLQPWAEHDQRKDRPSKWELQPSDGDGYLKYLWEHCEEWRYNLKGTSDMMSAAHGISCITRNYVELPTAVKHGALRIKIGGKVELTLTLQTTDLHTATSSVNWSTQITVQTIGSGIKVNTLGSHDPVFSKAEFSDGSMVKFRNPMDMLREAFPAKVDLDELVREISAFEGAWQYYYPLTNAYSLASPVFSDDGDLLFELRRHGATASRTPMSPSSAYGGRSSPVPRRIGRPRTPVGNTRTPGSRSPSTPRSPSRPAVLRVHAASPTTHTSRGEFVAVNGGTGAPVARPSLNLDLGSA
ncbi:hypothetical protein C8T65DRAFT_633331 [Cerioporus squamosus]|nr:hypothetical protein C8T65DRAFT_633331 [Cerioporus squamosus]